MFCGIRPESLVSPEQVAPFFVTGTIFLSPRPSLVCVEKFTLPYLTSIHRIQLRPTQSRAGISMSGKRGKGGWLL